MAVHTKVFAVDCYSGIAASGTGSPCSVKQIVAEKLVHQGSVLFVIVEREVV